MVCPFCLKEAKTRVYNSRSSGRKSQVWRRRRCPSCKEAFTTYESLDLSYLVVGKRDGHSEKYSRPKLFSSIYRAHLDADEAEALTDTVEQALINVRQTLISTKDVAEQAKKVLKAFDAASHARYASFQPPTTRT